MQNWKREPYLDNRLFPAFMAAAETENFTSAAKKIFMTQSGISQHIARLEEQLGLPLFKRVAKHVTLTDTGKSLKRFIEAYYSQTDTFLGEIHDAHNRPSGRVRYAMPPSSLFLPHFSLLFAQLAQFPEITLDVTLVLDQEVLEKVLEDQVDFGLVTLASNHPNLSYRPFFHEEYLLVSASRQVINTISSENISNLHYIAYPGAEIHYNRWLRHYFPCIQNHNFLSMPISGRVNSIEGAILMVQEGIGVSVFPRHCIEKLIEVNGLFAYRNNSAPFPSNQIFIVTLKDFPYSRATRLVMDWISSGPQHDKPKPR